MSKVLENEEPISLGKFRDKKKKKEKENKALKYKWLVTYNEKGSFILTVIKYVTKKEIAKFSTSKKLVPATKEYLANMAKKLGYKSGTLTVWTLSPSVQGEPSRIFSPGEEVDAAELDETYAIGEYEHFSSYFINSHLRVIKY